MDVFEFSAPHDGTHLLVLGGVHGNEPCGCTAIDRIVSELQAGQTTLQKGRLTCIPRVNGPALAQNTRFIDRNLNRILGTTDTGDSEGRIAESLKPHLARAGYLLDLHSYTSGGPPFVFAGEDAATMAFARSLPAAAIITGFQACYQAAFPDQTDAGVGTTEYARAKGCVAVTFECGQHADPQAPVHAYAAIRAALAHTGLVAADAAQTTPPPRHLRMSHVFVKTGAGAFARPWRHLDPIARGDAYARMEDGRVQTAPADGYVVLPKEDVGAGVEWGYLGVETNP